MNMIRLFVVSRKMDVLASGILELCTQASGINIALEEQALNIFEPQFHVLHF